MIENQKQSVNILTECIKDSIRDYEFKWEIFFDKWFRQNGTSLFFVFKRNLSLTNTQYSELFALVNLHHNKSKSTKNGLLFHTTNHLKDVTIDAINILLENYNPSDTRKIRNFAEQYIDVYCHTAAVDLFFGSCAIFLPYEIEIDLEKVVFESGYIHSSGKSIYVRNIKKSKKHDFLTSLENYININKSEKPIHLIFYSHEDFSQYDKSSSELLNKGIEQCKLFVEKMSMGRSKLSEIINEIDTDLRYKEKLQIPKAGNYKNYNIHSDKSIWVITDRSISGTQINNPGQNRYYICFEQLFKNESPFFYFDENKPAWKSHTTMPHSLTAALLNISRTILKNGEICDPFGGTGTTWFEAKRIGLKNNIRCSDLSSACNLMVKDNLDFFCLSKNQLLELKAKLETCSFIPKNESQTILNFENFDTESPIVYAHNLLKILKKENPLHAQEYEMNKNFVQLLENQMFITRILFYICLRADLRFQSGFARKSINFAKAFDLSANEFINQLKRFVKLKEKYENTNKNLEKTYFNARLKIFEYIDTNVYF